MGSDTLSGGQPERKPARPSTTPIAFSGFANLTELWRSRGHAFHANSCHTMGTFMHLSPNINPTLSGILMQPNQPAHQSLGISRRTFVQTAAATSLAAMTAPAAGAVFGANDRVRLGVIGVGNRGDQLIDAFLPHKDAQIVALCDVYEPYLNAPAKKSAASRTSFTTIASCSTKRTSTPSSSPRPTTGTRCSVVDACRGRQGRVRREAAEPDDRRRARRWSRWPKRHEPRDAGRPASPIVEVMPGSGRADPQRRDRQITSATATTLATSLPMGIGNPPDGEPPPGLGLGHVARAGAQGAVQPEPLPVQVPLVPRLLRRPAHQPRHALPRRDPMGPRPERAAVGVRRSAASTPSTTTAKSPTRWKSFGNTTARRSSHSRSTTPTRDGRQTAGNCRIPRHARHARIRWQRLRDHSGEQPPDSFVAGAFAD